MLCNFVEGVIVKARQMGLADQFPTHWGFVTGWMISPEFGQVWSVVKDDEEFWKSLKPHKEALANINFLVSGYVTQRPVLSSLTWNWIADNGFQPRPVGTAGASKIELIRQMDLHVFVDDKPENFDEINDAGIRCLLLDRPWNRQHDDRGFRIDSLAEVGPFLKAREAMA